RVLAEDLAVGRRLDVALDADEPVLAGHVEDVVEHLEQLGVRGPAVLVRLEQADRPDADLLQHAGPVADDERAKTGAANDDELGHLHQHTDGTAVHRIADVDASEYNDQSNS